MTRTRRACAVIGLSLVVGTLAATDVARREAELKQQLSPEVDVVVAAKTIPRAHRVEARDLGTRRLPARFAPAGGVTKTGTLVGQRAAVTVGAGEFLTVAQMEQRQTAGGGLLNPGERAVEIIGVGSPELVTPGTRVDVLVTRDNESGAPGRTELALEGAEVIYSRAVANGSSDEAAARVAATLRVTARQAIYLADAEAFARTIRLLPRAAGNPSRPLSGPRAGGRR